MTPDALNRAARQIALPEIGLDGQERIAAATVVVAGDDLTSEVAARALAAAGSVNLRLVRRGGAVDAGIAAALRASNPDVDIQTREWPAGAAADAGAEWAEILTGSSAVLRSGFDDDSMLRAAVRLGIPVVVTRGRDDRVDVVSFRRHGPCPHLALDVPPQPGLAPQDGPGAVIAAEIAASEVLALIAGAAGGEARARHLCVRLAAKADAGSERGSQIGSQEQTGVPSAGGGTDDAARATDIPWSPECFACGGSGQEMNFR